MISIRLFQDGAYIKGHSDLTVCSVVSYAMRACICDCLDEGELVKYYQSANDSENQSLGFTYIEIDVDNEEHKKIFDRFKRDIWVWVDNQHREKVNVYNNGTSINWHEAIKDV